MRVLFSLVLVVSLVGIMIPNAFAENVPEWVKNTAGWWATDAISETEFVNAVEFLVKENIIQINVSQTSETTQSVPEWVKNTAGWWATDAISETEFVNAIAYLIKVGIINVQQQLTPQIEIENIFEKKVVKITSDELNPYINSHGFRGSEIEKNKPDNTFRIFAVGGSTTFSTGVEDEFTWPTLLQENLDSLKTTTKIEVVNAGHAGATSYSNSKLIKTKLITFEPDLVIVYEGVNDQACLMTEYENANTLWNKQNILGWCEVYILDEYPFHMAERYSELCEFAQKNGFEVIISLQPTVDLENKILTNQEIKYYFERPQYSILLDDYEKLKKTILERTYGCSAVVDLSGIFDDYDLPIYYDYHHVGKLGNSIVAENILDLVVPILAEKNILDEKPNDLQTIKPKKYERGQDLKNSDFSGKDLKDKNFFGADLSGSNFEGSILTNADFRLANLENTNFVNAEIDNIKLRQNNLKNADFTNVDFSQVNLMNVDFTNTILKNSNLSTKNLTKTFFYKSDLSGADLTSTDLSFVFFKDTILKNANLTGSLLYESDLSLALDSSGIILAESGITHSNLVGIDFSGKNLQSVNFYKSDLTGQDFTNNVNLREGTSFQEAILVNANFEGTDHSSLMYTIIFENKAHLKNLPESEMKNQIMTPADQMNRWIISTDVDGNDLIVNFIAFNWFKAANLENANFKDAILWFAYFHQANFRNAELSGADLRSALLVDADLSNANLEGANLSNANLEGANLEGANLTDIIINENTILKCKNHPRCI